MSSFNGKTISSSSKTTNPPPVKFLWGVSTSAFQIEGDLVNDMTEWEDQGNFRVDGKNPRYNQAVHHWKHWKEDFELLKQLGVNSYRFSMDWGRIEPSPGQFNQTALDRYEEMVDSLLKMDIEPMLTLHHFTHPRWFHDHSPWHQPASIEAFHRYVQKILERFASKIKFYVTFNEPVVWALAGYGDGKFPPGEKDLNKVALSLKHMLLAHRRAYDLIKNYRPDSRVGIANNHIIFAPQRVWSLLDRGITFLINRFYNFAVFEAFRHNRLKISFPYLLNYDEEIALDNSIDFWGINYYYRLHVRFIADQTRPMEFKFIDASGEGFSDLGWEIYSPGLWKVINWLNKSGKPIIITENGIADAHDVKREKFLKSHFKVIESALRKNIDLQGYYYWSLLDNYEWLEGTDACFGLYRVDYQNSLRRSLRESGHFFSSYIKNFRYLLHQRGKSK